MHGLPVDTLLEETTHDRAPSPPPSASQHQTHKERTRTVDGWPGSRTAMNCAHDIHASGSCIISIYVHTRVCFSPSCDQVWLERSPNYARSSRSALLFNRNCFLPSPFVGSRNLCCTRRKNLVVVAGWCILSREIQ